MTHHEFLVWCILCGNDYFDKANVFPGYGCEPIRQWVMTTQAVTRSLVESVVAGSTPVRGSAAFQTKLEEFSEFVEVCRARATRKQRAPNKDLQAVALRQFMFVYGYWCVPWNRYQRYEDTLYSQSTAALSTTASASSPASISEAPAVVSST